MKQVIEADKVDPDALGSDSKVNDDVAPPNENAAFDGEPDSPVRSSLRGRQSPRHRYQRRPQRVRRKPGIPASPAADESADRVARLRLLSTLAVGVVCLIGAHWLRSKPAVFDLPSGVHQWIGMFLGIVGVWLIPGVWLTAIFMRIGAGPVAWAATRIGTTLCWYALWGPVIHYFGRGALVTTGGILIATLTATAAVALGVALGLLRLPTRLWQRALLAAAIGGACTQVAITVSMRMWNHDMNYSHIRRLDWLIVLGCVLLVTAATLCSPDLPKRRTLQNSRSILAAAAVAAASVAALVVTNIFWSPAQQMPSSFSVEQIAATGDADLAFDLAPIGPDGRQLLDQAEFTATDESGRAVPVLTKLVPSRNSATNSTLLVTLRAGTQSVACRVGRSAKLTLHDLVTGVRIQALLPDSWCDQ